MSKPVIITCAVTGGIHTPTMSPYLPFRPKDIADSAIEASRAGATILHLHAREPQTGKPDSRPETFLKFLPRIKENCDSVINISTGGGLGMTPEQRVAAALSLSPEMAPLNVGSMNFGIFPLVEKHANWKHDWEPEFLKMTEDFIFRNTFIDIEFILKELGEGHGTRFEFECYDLGASVQSGLVYRQGHDQAAFFYSDGVRDVGRAMAVSARLRYGFTWVNTHGVGTPEMPWAAMKGSGNGCDMSVYALDAYTAIRHVMIAHE